LPHSQSKDSDDDVEEERRLCYVGITRAQRDLFLIHTRYRAKYGQRSACVPSRFLSEIPVDIVEEIDRTVYSPCADKRHIESAAGHRESSEEDYQYDAGESGYDELPEFQLDEHRESIKLVSGDIVNHEIFGRGRVVKIAPSSDTVHVDFNRVGMKKLALEYANLEKVEGSCR
jgi:DNA helicase-2/ATP-dependent DNA helicase PcrA